MAEHPCVNLGYLLTLGVGELALTDDSTNELVLLLCQALWVVDGE